MFATVSSFFVQPVCVEHDIVVTSSVRCLCFVRACVHCACVRAPVQICPDHNLYIYTWISKYFGTVVFLEEQKCHLKHLLRQVEGQGHN